MGRSSGQVLVDEVEVELEILHVSEPKGSAFEHLDLVVEAFEGPLGDQSPNPCWGPRSPDPPGIYRFGAIRILLSDAGAVWLKTTPSCVLAPESASGLAKNI